MSEKTVLCVFKLEGNHPDQRKQTGGGYGSAEELGHAVTNPVLHFVDPNVHLDFFGGALRCDRRGDHF